VSKTAHYHKAKRDHEDEAIADYLKKLANQHKRWGCDKMTQYAKTEGKLWNHKRIRRVYRELNLHIRIKPRKRLQKGQANALVQPLHANHCWSMDFMSDALICGRRFRTFNVLDDYNRQALLIEPSFTLPAVYITQLLDQIAVIRGYPDRIRTDHGPEFESSQFKDWAKSHGIEHQFIQPGKPAQNGFIERFNRTYREAVLDMNWFNDLAEVKQITQEWMKSYNGDRPHESLGGLAPIHFANVRQNKLRENSTFNQ